MVVFSSVCLITQVWGIASYLAWAGLLSLRSVLYQDPLCRDVVRHGSGTKHASLPINIHALVHEYIEPNTGKSAML